MAVHIFSKTPAILDVGGKKASFAAIGDDKVFSAASRYDFTRTLDRSFGSGAGITPASGGGNVSPQEFEHDGEDWELWQVVPFLGSGVSPVTVGDARVHLRNRSKSRGTNELGEMPAEIILTRSGWSDSPWRFTRPTASNKFSNAGSGNSARKQIDYEPVRTIAGGDTPTSEGIVQGQEFMATLIWRD